MKMKRKENMKIKEKKKISFVKKYPLSMKNLFCL